MIDPLRRSLEQVYDSGSFPKVNPDHWARTYNVDPEHIRALMEKVSADRATRIAPNTIEEGE